MSHYRDAFTDYQRAIKTMPDLPEPYVGRGNIYFLAGKLNKAIDDYTRALDLHLTRNYIAYLNRGMAYEKLGRFDVAEADYRQALKAQPDWELAQKKLNRVLAKQAAEKVH
ncbi:MAG: tetratricopeptide repeat protein [Gammaproteobacteria bacterium]